MRPLTHRLLRALSWHRRLLAALAAAIACFSVLQVVAPKPPETVPAVVLTHAVAAGATLQADDVAETRLPVEAVSDTALTSSREVVGRVLVAPLPSRAIVTSLSLLSAKRSVRAGLVLAPVRLADDEIAGLVEVGSVIDLFGGSPDGAVGRVATNVRVVTVLPPSSAASGAFSSDSGTGPVVLVEVAPSLVERLVAASAQGPLQVALH